MKLALQIAFGIVLAVIALLLLGAFAQPLAYMVGQLAAYFVFGGLWLVIPIGLAIWVYDHHKKTGKWL